jgi:glutathione S-transferase
MLLHKGLEFRETRFPSGLHPVGLRLSGFEGGTVPVVRVDGHRIEGSLRISRALEELRPRPALFPEEPERRRRVEAAEAWGSDELQEAARRLTRWSVVRHVPLRRDVVRLNHLPFVRMTAFFLRPLAVRFAERSRADDAHVREDLRRLPEQLGQVDEWIADGLIGSDEPNAADFQIAPSLRLLLAFDDLKPLLEGTAARGLALRYQPRFPIDIDPVFPRDWIPHARPDSTVQDDASSPL